MKNLIILFLLIHLGLSAQTEQLQVIGTHLSNEKGDAVVLRGMSLGWHNWWPKFYNRKTVKWLKKDWKINIIRAAMGVDADENSYLKNRKSSIKTIEKVIDAAIENDMYVIVDWHSHNIYLNEAKEFFDYISKKYGHHPNIIYEIFNEPDDETWPEIKAYAEEVIQTIRKNDADNIILIGTPRWDQEVQIAAENPILNHKNLMYTLHFYASTHGQELRDKGDIALAKGLPIFVSESGGMEASGDGRLNVEEWGYYVDWMEKNKLSWVAWSVSDKDETCSVLKPNTKATGKWKEKDLKDWGKLVREKLRYLNSN